MNPCQWWTASPQGEIVFDCNVLSDAVCNNSRRGDWANAMPSEVVRSPLLGEHTFEIMREGLGFSAEEIEAARAEGAIGSEDAGEPAAA